MTVMFVTMVGNRDLCVNGSPIPQERFRDTCRELKESFADHRATLSAPIIERSIGWILDPLGGGQTKIDRILLICTDQPPAVEERHRQRDTLEAAEVINKFLKHGTYANSLGRITPVPIVDYDPSQYGQMFDWFRQRYASRTFPAPEDVSACYIAPVGGIPAATAAMLVEGVNYYGEICQALYLPDQDKVPVPMNIALKALKTRQQREALAYVEAESYLEAAGLLDQLELGPGRPLAALARACAYRLHFDFERAISHLNAQAVQAASGPLNTYIVRLRNHLHEFPRGRQPRNPSLRLQLLRLAELSASAGVRLYRGQYGEFLALLIRFQEATLRYLVQHYLGLEGTENSNQHRRGFIERVEQLPDLKAHLDGATFEGSDLTWQEHCFEIPTLLEVTVALGHDINDSAGTPLVPEAELEKLPQVARRLQLLQELRPLRNRSIVGHGFESVSKERLAQEYSGDINQLPELMEQTAASLESTGIPTFQQADRILIAGIQNLEV